MVDAAGAGRVTTAGGCIAGVGFGTVVATVAGVPHAAKVNDERRATSDNDLPKGIDFMSDLA